MRRSGSRAGAEDAQPAPVVIVDPDPDDIYELRGLLQVADWRHPVVTFTDARHAIDYLGYLLGVTPEAQPCLLLTELRMAPVDGFELIRWLRAQAALAALRIVGLSRENSRRELTRARALGADFCCRKFPTPEELRGLLAGHSRAP